jgi:hypothetical protein
MAIKTYRILRERQAHLLNATIQRLKMPLLAGGGVVSVDADGNFINSASVPGAPGVDLTWGSITGTLSDQTDLNSALSDKLEASDIANKVDNTTTVNSQALSSNVTLDADDISDASTTKKFVTDTEKSTWNGKPDNKADIGLGSVPNLDTTNAVNNAHTHANKATLDATQESFTTTLKNKLDGVDTGANNYTHPATHPPSIITQDASNRFVTDAEKSTWNSKLDSVPSNTDAAKIANGTVSNTEFQYLNGVTSAIQTQINSKTPKITRTTQSNLTCNFASTNYIVATVTGNQSFSLSNVPTDEIVTVLIINTGGGDITLPNTADYFSAATFTHAAGGVREYSIFYDGTNRYWQVSEELT